MYAVIFRAEIDTLDEAYSSAAVRMRDLAIKEYGCIEFTSATEGNQEIAISYWENQEQISRWRENPEHKKVQEMGRTKWYRRYQVQVVEIKRDYKSRT